MESEPGVRLGTAFYQHQFFPGATTGEPDPVEAKWDKYGRYVDNPATADWDVKAWDWDSLLFLAQPSNTTAAVAAPAPERGLMNSHFQGGGGGVKRGWVADPKQSEKPIVVVDDASSLDEDSEVLTLKLGGRTYSTAAPGTTTTTTSNAAAAAAVEELSRSNGKRQRSSSPTQQQQPQQQQQQQYPMCQVDDCKADLSSAKDYHRRHKVCEMHSKAAKALVNRLMQRFCQQCSRFHTLQEFDEGKRSCRRRLAGHNRRRRKTQPEAAAAQAYLLADEEVAGKSAALLRLLQVFTQLQAPNSVEKVTERDIAMEYLRRAVSVSAALGDCLNTKTEVTGFTGNAQKAEQKFNSVPANLDAQLLSALPGMPLLEAFSVLLQNNQKGQGGTAPQAAPAGRPPLTDYVPARGQQVNNRATVPGHSVIEVDGPPVQKFFPFQSGSGEADKQASRPSLLTLLGGRDSPPSSVAPTSNIQAGQSQQSSESLSGSEQSPESSYADWQDRTGRISFKLFDRNPGDFPQLLRSQILEWLSHVPLEMESYIRPGCVILAIFLSMPRSAWKKICNDLPRNLERLLESSSSDFWKKGRILVQVLDVSAYVVDGKVQDAGMPSLAYPKIWSVSPLAAVRGEATVFEVQGSNLIGPDTSVFCACDGKYNLLGWNEVEADAEPESRSLSLTHETTDSIGRCFIEVECDGVSAFAPVLVAEKSLCEEVRSLEDELMDASSTAAAVARSWNFPESIAEEFSDLALLIVEHESDKLLQELGWVFQKRHWQSIRKHDGFQLDSASIKRLLMLTVERGWCSVVETILDMLFDSEEQYETVQDILQSVNVLHRAVRRNNLSLVESLLSYKSPTGSFVFLPDAAGPAGLTPLHIAACVSGAEQVVAALTSAQVGLQAWNNARDLKGDTPFDCALTHGNLTYIQLVWSRIAAIKGKSAQVIVNIPPTKAMSGWTPSSTPGKAKLLLPSSCSNECRKLEQERQPKQLQSVVKQMAGLRSPMYRPFMLSMVAIAAVCVCVCLLLKGPPEVRFVLSPFTWESVQFGPK